MKRNETKKAKTVLEDDRYLIYLDEGGRCF